MTDSTSSHTDTLARYHAVVRRRFVVLAALVVAIAAAFVMDLVVGPSQLTIREAVDALWQGAGDTPAAIIIWNVRLPYAVMALLVGAALALAGAEMQTILDNPLASPFTLGTSSAAIFGAALAIVLNLSLPGVPSAWLISANAFVFALGSGLLLYGLARLRSAAPETTVLFGIALFFTFNALVAILQFVASEQALQQVVFWTMGSLSRSTWASVQLLALAVVVVAPFSLRAAWQMTALKLGDERARSFGVDIDRLRVWSLVRISVLTAAAVAFVGTIAFVGLVGPHLARLLIGEDHRFLLPASALTGALVMALASFASKTILPGVIIPIGLVTALIGVPFFMWLVFSKRTRM